MGTGTPANENKRGDIARMAFPVPVLPKRNRMTGPHAPNLCFDRFFADPGVFRDFGNRHRGAADQAFSVFAFSSMKFLNSISAVMTSSIRKKTNSLRRLSRAIWFSPAISANSMM